MRPAGSSRSTTFRGAGGPESVDPVLAYLLLAVAQAVGLALIATGGPGGWLQLAAIGLFGWSTDFALIRESHIYILLLLTVSAELIVASIAGRQREPSPRTASVLGLLGAIAGAGVGFLVPLLGPILGAFGGAVAGATADTLRGLRFRDHLPRHIAAITVRSTVGVTLAVFTLLILYR